jgi:hypothetical protein
MVGKQTGVRFKGKDRWLGRVTGVVAARLQHDKARAGPLRRSRGLVSDGQLVGIGLAQLVFSSR